MANISNVSFRIDSDLKAQADTLFSQLGMNMTTWRLTFFLRQSVREGRISVRHNYKHTQLRNSGGNA